MRVAFVAEVSSNHNGSLERCLEFVDTAARIGCAAVKFQLFRVDRLFAPEILDRSEEHRRRREWELPEAFLPRLAARCRDRGIGFSCTPFDLDAVQTLAPLVDFFKIASYELPWDALLEACARTGKPVVLSTGMATLDEVGHAVETLRRHGCTGLTLLHCVSGYPTPPGECNLAAIETLRNAFGCPAGWSDHSVSPAVVLRAVHRWGASMVEFHLDLEGAGAEFGGKHCWLPGPAGDVIRSVDTGVAADGNGRKEPAPSERGDRDWRADPSDGLRPVLSVRRAWEAGP